MNFRGYHPGQRLDPPAQFSTIATLRALPRVLEAIEEPGFDHLSLDMDGRPSVMAEFRGGSYWIVVGYIDPPVFNIGLPLFRFRSPAFAAPWNPSAAALSISLG